MSDAKRLHNMWQLNDLIDLSPGGLRIAESVLWIYSQKESIDPITYLFIADCTEKFLGG